MLAVQVGCGREGDVELGVVGVGAGIGHGQNTTLVMLQLEVLILQSCSSSRAVKDMAVQTTQMNCRLCSCSSASCGPEGSTACQ